MDRTNLTEKNVLKGHVRITIRNEETGEERVYEQDNLIVDLGANLLRDFLKGDAVTGLTHLAIGTDATAPSDTDTGLLAEAFRKAFTDVAVDNRKLVLITFIASGEWSGTVSELGLFGNGATDSLGTGTLFSRVTPESISKSNIESLTVEWTLNF